MRTALCDEFGIDYPIFAFTPSEHVAAAVFALVGGDLSQTTGLHVPVDAGVAAAFLR